MIQATDALGCLAQDSIIITVNELPTSILLEETVPLCAGEVATIDLEWTAGQAGDTFSWSPATGLSDATVANPTATVSEDVVYNLTVTNAAGCTAEQHLFDCGGGK